jgi:hypothetical protein
MPKRRPEHVLERHLDRAAVGQTRGRCVALGDAVDHERDVHALRGLVAAGRAVGAHQLLTGAEHEPRVHDLVAVAGRHSLGGGRAAEAHQGFKFRPEQPLVELEGGLALSIEVQVGNDLHRRLLSRGCRTSAREIDGLR